MASEPATLLKRDSNTGDFLCFRSEHLLEEHLRMTASKYQSTMMLLRRKAEGIVYTKVICFR